MQRSVFNRAMVRVANTTEVSDRVTADGVNRDRFHNRFRKVCALVAATLILPALAYAQNNQGDNQIAALQAQITALKNQVNTLQSQMNAVLSSNVYALKDYVSVDPNPGPGPDGLKGPNISFHGANIHILSGSGATDDGSQSNGESLRGLGNLIIGYDETNGNQVGRGGSHNLVIGRYHSFTSSAFGGLVAGEGNTISNGLASVTGGLNTVSGYGASISGGLHNTASGVVASVTGGQQNTASGFGAVVIGGANQMASDANSIAPQNLSLFP
jgi:hypothetical protein